MNIPSETLEALQQARELIVNAFTAVGQTPDAWTPEKIEVVGKIDQAIKAVDDAELRVRVAIASNIVQGA